MEYLVTMTTHVPDGTSKEAVSDVRAREAVRSRELAAQGPLLRLWRPPLQPGEWRTLGLFAAGDDGQLEKVLASMPLRAAPGRSRDTEEGGCMAASASSHCESSVTPGNSDHGIHARAPDVGQIPDPA